MHYYVSGQTNSSRPRALPAECAKMTLSEFYRQELESPQTEEQQELRGMVDAIIAKGGPIGEFFNQTIKSSRRR